MVTRDNSGFEPLKETTMHDYQRCGGPRTCHYCQTILIETPDEACARIQEDYGFRAGIHTHEENFDMTDAYSPHIAALRAQRGDDARYAEAHRDDAAKLEAMEQFRDRLREQRMLAALQAPPATGDVYANPPDGYSIALAKRKETLR